MVGLIPQIARTNRIAAGGLAQGISRFFRRPHHQHVLRGIGITPAHMHGHLRSSFLTQITSLLKTHPCADGHAAMLFLDLNGFKQLNTAHGYATGDRLLAAIAQRLHDIIQQKGVLGRLGGDEFACFIPHLAEDRQSAVGEAIDFTNRIRASTNEALCIDGKNFDIGCGIGIDVVKSDAVDPDLMLKCAEMAMYAAKSDGQNHARLFEDYMLRSAEETAMLISELRDAIDDAEFELAYQPQVTSSGHLIGAEALIRWNHPEKGSISPLNFIPIAEESGLIDPLTNWVMEQALDTLVRWQRHPQLRRLSLSVNVCAPQIHQDEFLKRVRYYARHYDIDMSRLVIEITERVFFGDLETVHRVMAGLRDLGIRFSLDDYGTGYSSLAQLRHLRFDELKIDGTFIRDLATNDHDKAILRSTLAMAKALDVRCVAECVETEEQRQFLWAEGCDYLQGFLFGKAVRLDRFEQQALQ